MHATRRHDRVWLRFDAPTVLSACAADAHEELVRWRARGLPLICARSDRLPDSHVQLGLTLPGTGPRRRVGLVAARADIVRCAPLPSLSEVLDTPLHTLPGTHGPALHALLADCRSLGVTPRVYGALLWQWLSDTPCLRPDSDIDLLFDLDDHARPDTLPALLARLAQCDGSLRIDGEIRCGAQAVAWRELAAAVSGSGPRRVLAKSDSTVALINVNALWPAEHCAA